MEYWNDGLSGRKTINLLFPLLIPTIPKLQHSIIPCGWHKPITLRDNGVPLKFRKLQAYMGCGIVIFVVIYYLIEVSYV